MLAAGKVYADAPLPIDSARNGSWTFSAWIFPTTAGNLGIASLRADRDSPRFGLALVGGRPRLTMWRPFETSEIWHATVSDPLPLNRWRHVCVVFSDDPSETGSVRFYVDGAESAHHGERFDGIDQNVEGEGKEPTEPDADAPLEQPVGLRLARVGEAGFRGMLGEIRLYARAVNEREAAGLAENDPLAVLLAIRPEERTADQQAALVRGYLHAFSEEYQRTTAELEQIEHSRSKLSRTIPTVMVMRDGPPRPTFVLAGGNYRRPRDAVEAGLPAWLAPSAEKPFDRLALAHWLCAPENPLTARVVVNRVWPHYFGTGLVTTAEDFGTRGALPSHPELLDWLACEFRDSGWDRKHLHRLIVTSAVYRQASRVTADSIRRDPKNRLLARGPAVRLPAEVIRDSVLASGNLLHEKIGGPSVFPYQPPGLWREVSVSPEDYTAQVYLPGTGDQWYRRALYTFWKRTSPPPALTAFDAPNRESCIVARDRSNTPQQALVLWNDPAFVEAARGLAVYMLQVPEEGIDVRLARGFRRVLCRTPEPRELEILRELLVKEREYYEAHPSDARSLTAVGQSAPPENLPDIELAAYLNIATTLFSLDEFLCPR